MTGGARAAWEKLFAGAPPPGSGTAAWLGAWEAEIAACSAPVLDLGCGSGGDTDWLLERGSRSDAMDGSKAQLAAKQACVDEAFAQAGRALQQMPREEYIRVLARMAAQAGEGSEELIFSPADAQAVGQAVVEEANRLKAGASFTLSAQQRDMEGGLVLKKGDVEINCDFATQLRLLRQSMAADVAAMLFS